MKQEDPTISATLPDQGSLNAEDDARTFLDSLVEEGIPANLVQLPGDENYERNRNNHFNLDMICHPLLFVTPTTTEEVSRAVRGYTKGLKVWWQQRQQEQQQNVGEKGKSEVDTTKPNICICAGRHSTRSFRDGSVILDLSLMQQVVVDAPNQTVTVEGGVKIGTMLDALAPYHLAAVTGTHADTGVIGLTMGGGQGFLSKQFGPAVDQIVSAEIVMADGSIKTVHRDTANTQEQDILFNIRGGGGNIGVATKLTMKVYPIRNIGMLESVNFVFTQQGVQDVLVRFGEWTLSAPDDCTAVAILPLRAPVVVVLGISCNSTLIRQDTDPATAASSVDVAQLPGISDLKANRLGTWFRLPAKFSVKDYNTEAMKETSKNPPGNYYYTNVLVPSITTEIAAVFAEAQRGKISKGIEGAVLLFNHAGEKTAQVPVSETAFEMRDKKYWFLCQTTWKTTGDKDRDSVERAKVVKFNNWFRQEVIKAGGQKTIHAVTNKEEDFNHATDYGFYLRETNMERMVQSQKALDPDGIFRVNQTVH